MNTTLKNEPRPRPSHSLLELPPIEPWPEPVDGAKLLDDLQGIFNRYVVLPQWSAQTLALWTLHTYAFECPDVSTYLGLESPEKRCGKTTLLTVLSELVNRPVVAANISSPALFRVIEEMRPTLLIDEADTFLHGNDELRGILNSGYTRKTAYVVRVASQVSRANFAQQNAAAAGPTSSRLVRFSCWCPKVMAAIGRLPDTLADRCIVIKMQRKTPAENCERLRNLDPTALRRQCARFARDHAQAITAARPLLPDSMNDRAGDILGAAPHPRPRRRRRVARTGPSIRRPFDRPCPGEQPITSLLLDIALQFIHTGADRFFSRMLLEGLNNSCDRSWSALRSGREINEHWLALQLRPQAVRQKILDIAAERNFDLGRGSDERAYP